MRVYLLTVTGMSNLLTRQNTQNNIIIKKKLRIIFKENNNHLVAKVLVEMQMEPIVSD